VIPVSHHLPIHLNVPIRKLAIFLCALLFLTAHEPSVAQSSYDPNGVLAFDVDASGTRMV